MEKRDYTISDIYQGGYSSLSPSGNMYRAGSFGMTTDPRSANILQEVSSKLSSGVKQIEIEGVMEKTFDSIPKQHMQEIHRLSKLTGVDISLHGPVIDVAGFTQNGFSEPDREIAQRKVAEALLRSHDLNPDGNIPVNFHTSEGLPGSQLLPPKDRTAETKYKKMLVVNRETGRLAPVEAEERFYPGGKGGEVKKVVHTPEQSLQSLNHTEWENTLSQVEFNRQRVDEILKDVDPITRQVYVNKLVAERYDPKLISPQVQEDLGRLDQAQVAQFPKIHAAIAYSREADKAAGAAFSKAWKTISNETPVNDQQEMEKREKIKFLQEISKQYGETLGAHENGKIDIRSFDPHVQSTALYRLIEGLEKVAPTMWVPVEEFAIEKTSKTYGNAAYDAYKKFKDKSPILVIENPPAGHALSTGKDVRDVVEASQKKFIENAMKDGMSEKDAKKQAEKLIGATWDVGHINMLRKFGYSPEEIIKETEQVAPYIKHVHLSDNFGFEHTELPMGMGNVPLKEIMEKLGEKGFNARKIIEAADWWQHFRTPPFQEVLESTGSPLYSMNMAPYWSQAPGLYQGYNGGLAGQWLPQINYETFGTTFSRLPQEVGGSTQGAQGNRMSGRGME